MKQTFIERKGSKVYKDNVSLLMQALSVTKENNFFPHDKKISYAKRVQTFLDSVGERPSPAYDNCNIINNEVVFEDQSETPLYKYISKDTLNNYILKGQFRLGSLYYYQYTQNKNIQDYLEGFSHLVINYKNRQMQQAFFSGFNYLIFCGTHVAPDDPRADYLLNNFGECVIKIKEPKAFTKAISEILKAKSSSHLKIKYEPIKIIDTSIDKELIDFDKQILTEELFDFICSKVTPLSIFMKSDTYSPENEVRIAFEMEKDMETSYDISCIQLLDYVEIIKN